MYEVKCDAENNPPEVIERNELRATIYLTPYKWADDVSYLAWHDPVLRECYEWQMNEFGEVEIVK
jgi:hypothetical protein